MIFPQLSLDLNHELIVDNFAGGGGASTGIELALGRNVDHAINHDRFALGMHRINHPQTIHHHEDVFEIDPWTMCEGRPVGLAHFSPDCRDFSKAKGGKPLDKRIRGLVLVMLRWAKYRARVMTMENVEEITGWGPLMQVKKNGVLEWQRDPAHKGRTWKAFLACLSTGIDPAHPDLPEILEVLAGTVTAEECIRGFGYKYEAREIRACDHGSPTIRKRLFMVARRDGCPIVWPAATHFDPHARGGRQGLAHRTIAECIDWTRPCPSIFLDKEQARAARCKRPLAPATLRRIAMGIDRYVLKSKRPFLVSVTHQGGNRVESVDEPARTVTGAHRGEKAVVVSRFNGDHQGRSDGATRNQSVEQPLSVQDTSNRFGLAEATLAPMITEHANASSQRNMPADEPMRTACGQVKGGHFAVVSANMVVNTTNHPGGAADAPAATLATGGHQMLVAGTMVQTGYSEADGQAPRALDVEKPLGTVVSTGKHAAVAATLIGAGGRAAQSRPRAADEPLHTTTSKGDTCLATATLVHTAHGEADRAGKKRRGRGAHDMTEPMPSVLSSSDAAVAMLKLRGNPDTHPSAPADAPAHTLSTARNHGLIAANIVRHFGESVGQPVNDPAPTTVAGGGGKTALAAAYLAQHNGGGATNPGHPADEPISTIVGTGTQQQLVAASVASYYGTAKDGQGVATPARTIPTKARKALIESSAVAPMTPEQVAGAHIVAAFLRMHGVKLDGEFATVQGFIIVDIGMRMLMPRELFRAQGFGEHYIIDRAWVVNPATGDVQEVFLTKEQQIRMCGNSVCPDVEAAIVRANVPELAARSQKDIRRGMAAAVASR